MEPREIIRRKRDSEKLSGAEIAFMVRGIADGSIGEGQIAAFAMAVFLRGMDRDERVALTREMTASGRVLDWAGAGLGGRPVLDKHSTGGVGDKVSLVLAPIVAACGGCVPMISARGLDHTGGTVDKLDAIPGYATAPDTALFRVAVREAGCAIIGQTADLAPADRRLYAVRDVTATVESVALITASILSKKLAAGLDALVMDVKTGNGAFAAGPAAARELAESIVAVAKGAGLACTALITDMDQVLGRTVGNALEVAESVAYLRGEGGGSGASGDKADGGAGNGRADGNGADDGEAGGGGAGGDGNEAGSGGLSGGSRQSGRDPRLHAVVMALAEEMLMLGGLATDAAGARQQAERALDDGRAAERFAAMVSALGGPADFVERPAAHLAAAPVVRPCRPETTGVVAGMNTREVGVVVVGLGGGRRRADDAIDRAVGLSEVCAVGEPVGPGPEERPLAVIHAANEADADAAAAALRAAVRIGEGRTAAAGVTPPHRGAGSPSPHRQSTRVSRSIPLAADPHRPLPRLREPPPAAAAGGRLPGHPRLRRPALLRHQHRRRVRPGGNGARPHPPAAHRHHPHRHRSRLRRRPHQTTPARPPGAGGNGGKHRPDGMTAWTA